MLNNHHNIKRANQEALNLLLRKARNKKKALWLPNGYQK
jgi:hypothetical protein